MFGSKKDDGEKTLYCSFCGKSQHKVAKLIAGPTVFICDECTELCWDIVKNEHKADLVKARDGETPPLVLTHILERSIAGFPRAKFSVSLAIIDRLEKARSEANTAPSADRVLLIGPVGCGKRLLAQAAADAMGVAFVATDESEISNRSASEVWERLVFGLIKGSAHHLGRAAKGLVYVEVGDDLPQGFEAFCNCHSVRVPEDAFSGSTETLPPFDTSRIMIVIGGPFTGLRCERGPVNSAQVVRLSSVLDGRACRELAQSLRSVSPEALVEYGFPKGLVEQIPYVAAMRDLYDGASEEDLGA